MPPTITIEELQQLGFCNAALQAVSLINVLTAYKAVIHYQNQTNNRQANNS